ncbi:MAG: transposase [Candidatus Taylorbacteria bacterium]|nr:transposase [Candidatus Taylorbacteria bacterium]
MGRNLNFSENEYYHLYDRAVEKRKIFLDSGDHKRFTTLLYTANSSIPIHLSNYQGVSLLEIPRGGKTIVDIGAWCIMPNHFHLLVKEKQGNGLSLFMRKLLTGYSMYFNAKYKRKGTLFNRPFRAKHLNTDEYLKYQYAYIHLNPIGIVDVGWKEKKLKDKSAAKKFLYSYKYSSFQDYSGQRRDEGLIIEPSSFPDYFGSFSDFGDMLEEWIDFENINIKESP